MNKLIHKVKTENYGDAPVISHKNFLPQAMGIAIIGKTLGRTICNIQVRMKQLSVSYAA